MGVGGTNENYKVLNNTAFTVANFRTAVIGSDFNSTFNVNSVGWTSVYGTWAKSASYGYLYGHGVSANGASAKHSGTYGDLTYTVTMARGLSTSASSNRIIIRGNPGNLVSTKWWGPSYVFQYANNGQFSIYYMNSSGISTPLKGWTSSAAIHTGYQWNTLKVVAVGSLLKFYINNVLVWSLTNTTLKTGSVGVGYYADSTSDWMYVDSAILSTTPTASDMNPYEDVAPGVENPGGTFDAAPVLP